MSRNLAVFIAIDAVDAPGAYEAVTVARIRGRDMVLAAARAAISEAEREAVEAERSDPALGIVHRGECLRLQTVLSQLLPELGRRSKPVGVPALTM
jgi:hypothetical protein